MSKRRRRTVFSERGTQGREAHPQALPTGEGVAVVMADPASRSDDIARAVLIHRLRWAADGVFSVPVSPEDARRLLEELRA